MKNQTERLIIRRAHPEDLQGIMAIEESSFSMPWPATTIAEDLASEGQSCYWVAVLNDVTVGYLGAWLIDLDFHVGSVATKPGHRRLGLAKIVMLCALRYAMERGVETVFLEHRRSNLPAARLYAQLGFHRLRIRRGYYTDNGEDAVELALSGLQEDTTRLRLDQEIDFWLRDHNYDVQLTDFECH